MCLKCASLCISRITPRSRNLEKAKSKKINENSHETYNFGNGYVLQDENTAAEELLSR